MNVLYSSKNIMAEKTFFCPWAGNCLSLRGETAQVFQPINQSVSARNFFRGQHRSNSPRAAPGAPDSPVSAAFLKEQTHTKTTSRGHIPKPNSAPRWSAGGESPARGLPPRVICPALSRKRPARGPAHQHFTRGMIYFNEVGRLTH